MKHLNTFEGFGQHEVKNEVFGWSKKEKEEKFRKELDNFITAYSKRMDTPTSEEVEEVVAAAKEDKFQGKPGVKKVDGEMKIDYRPSKDIKWRSGGHSFGSGE